jgi:hypothetical protein
MSNKELPLLFIVSSKECLVLGVRHLDETYIAIFVVGTIEMHIHTIGHYTTLVQFANFLGSSRLADRQIGAVGLVVD